jgi:hypothetical protein
VRFASVWGPAIAGVVVAVTDVRAAIYLRARFSMRPLGVCGTEVLHPHEIWIEPGEREEAERLLREECRSPHAWLHIIVAAFDSDAEHRVFVEAYSGLTGLPHALSSGANTDGVNTLALTANPPRRADTKVSSAGWSWKACGSRFGERLWSLLKITWFW